MTTQYKSFSELNDSQKQELANTFISTQTVIMQNDVVEYILEKSWEDGSAPFNYSDITNNECFGSVEIGVEYYQLTEAERDVKLEFYEYLRDKADEVMCSREPGTDAQYKSTDNYCRLDAIRDDLINMVFDENHEIYQWFLCSDYLIYKLEEKGECTLDDTYWGRTCFGQSIVLDNVIQTIAYEYYTNGYHAENTTIMTVLEAQ